MQTDGQRFFEKMIDAKHQQMDQSREIARLRAALTQIEIVCADNEAESCNHRMALKFVRGVAAQASKATGEPSP